MPVDEVGDLFGVELDDEDVDTVGGLMAKHLGKVPIPGAEVICEGLHFTAESPAGRRNKVVTVVVSPLGWNAEQERPAAEDDSSGEDATDSDAAVAGKS
jgi:Mg2+/Co2+ transporter CorC